MRKTNPTRKKVLTDFRRAEILAAAMVVFGKKGFDATRMDDVAQQARIAKGTLYLYFRSKRDIYTTAVQHASAQLQALTNERTGQGHTLEEKLKGFIAARVEFWGENRGLHRMLLSIGREATHHKQTLIMQRASVDTLLRIFTHAVESGEITQHPFEAAAWATLDLVRGANERRFLGVTKNAPEAEVNILVAFVLKTLHQ
jgi:AcrR family transcriptional regulator